MPRKNTEKEKRPHRDDSPSTWAGYWSRHPKEHARFKEVAAARRERSRVRRIAKHEPQLTDIQDNGKYVDVTFVRNGETVYGTYKLINLQIPSRFMQETANRYARFAARVAADEAREKLQREPGKTPGS